jgi:hypothetical protein
MKSLFILFFLSSFFASAAAVHDGSNGLFLGNEMYCYTADTVSDYTSTDPLILAAKRNADGKCADSRTSTFVCIDRNGTNPNNDPFKETLTTDLKKWKVVVPNKFRSKQIICIQQ